MTSSRPGLAEAQDPAPARAAKAAKAEATAKISEAPATGAPEVPMVSEPPGDRDGHVPDVVDRVVRRLGAHPSLPSIERSSPPALGSPSAVTDESRLVRDPAPEVVVDASWIYITLELPGVSRETLGITTTQDRLTVHALDAEGRTFHREGELPQPVEQDPTNVTYRNAMGDVSLRLIPAQRVRINPGRRTERAVARSPRPRR